MSTDVSVIADIAEFLSLRKIPLAPYPYLDASFEPSEVPQALDGAASALLQQMRAVVKTDRELVDRVSYSCRE